LEFELPEKGKLKIKAPKNKDKKEVKNMTTVVKKGGKRQAFSPAKIRRSVERAAKDAKVPPAKRKKLVKEVCDPAIALMKKKRSIKAADIRRSLLGRLARKSKKAASAWRKFDKKKKKKKK